MYQKSYNGNEHLGSIKAEKFLNGVELLLKKALYYAVWLITETSSICFGHICSPSAGPGQQTVNWKSQTIIKPTRSTNWKSQTIIKPTRSTNFSNLFFE
jgi:hypothetical protein